MTQEIKIPVKAQTDGSAREIKKLGEAADGVAQSVSDIDRSAKRAAASLDAVGAATRRLAQAKAILGRELGGSVSDADAEKFLSNFGRQRAGSSRTRAFDDFGSWYEGHARTFAREAHAQHHRRMVFARGMQGTEWAAANAPGMPGGGGGAGGGGFGGAARMGMGFARNVLALAGIGGVMAMAGRGIGNARTEGEALDGAKRRLGDVGVNYLHLQTSSRMAGQGLGLNYADSANLAGQYIRTAGNLTAGDMMGGRLSNNLRTAWGFSRAYGMDPAEGGNAFATMSRIGVARDENSQRKFAMLLADAINKGGYAAQAEELTRAVTEFAEQTGRLTLNTPNVGGYLNGMTSLMGTGIPGLDAAGAASVINTADASLRRGGGMGEASLNFNYAALRQGNPGLTSIGSRILMEQGLFGSVGGTFYGKGAIASFYQRSGRSPGLFPDFRTNFDKIMPMLRAQYGDGEMLLDATRNHFGMNSYGQAAALLQMQSNGQLGASANLASRAGIKFNEISASGMASFAAVANARDASGLRAAYDGIRSRKDLKRRDLMQLDADVAGAGSFEERQDIMARFIASKDQEKSLATETRDRLAAIENALTDAGQPLLRALNMMVLGLDVVARTINPVLYKHAQKEAARIAAEGEGGLPASRAAWGGVGGPGGKIAGRPSAALEASDMAYFMSKGYSKAQAAGIVGNLIQESGLNHAAVGDGGQAFGLAQWHPDRRALARRHGFDLSTRDGQRAFVDWELRNSESAAGDMLRRAQTPRQAAEAMIAYERPAGYRPGDPTGAHGYNSRLHHAERLGDTPLPADAGKGGDRYGLGLKVDVDGRVIIADSKGKEIGQAPLRGVARPVPAGGVPVRAGGY